MRKLCAALLRMNPSTCGMQGAEGSCLQHAARFTLQLPMMCPRTSHQAKELDKIPGYPHDGPPIRLCSLVQAACMCGAWTRCGNEVQPVC